MVFPFGTPGDQLIAGDWNGDGLDTIGIADIVFGLSVPGNMPIAGNWDGQP